MSTILDEWDTDKVHRVPDRVPAVALTMYDHGEDGPARPYTREAAREQYPDYREEDTLSFTGPIGDSPARGKPFPDMKTARKHFSKMYGEPLQEVYWPERKMNADGQYALTGAGKYGFKFLKKERK